MGNLATRKKKQQNESEPNSTAPVWKRRYFPARPGKPSPAKQADLDLKAGRIRSDQLDARRDWIVRMACCSAAWGYDIWRGEIQWPERRLVEYPPGGRLGTKMRQCRCCEKYMPPQVVGLNGRCYECYVVARGETGNDPSSFSVVTIYQLPQAERSAIRKYRALPDDVSKFENTKG